MSLWISLFRGINVGGHNKVTKDQLLALHAACGCQEAQTYIQSGNVVFRHADPDAASLALALANSLEQQQGIRAGVMLLSPQELETALAHNPYIQAAAADPATCLLGFMPRPPSPAQISQMKPVASEPDRFAIKGRVIYLHCPQGVARTKLTNAYFEKQLQTQVTFRNAQVAAKLLELSQGLGLR